MNLFSLPDSRLRLTLDNRGTTKTDCATTPGVLDRARKLAQKRVELRPEHEQSGDGQNSHQCNNQPVLYEPLCADAAHHGLTQPVNLLARVGQQQGVCRRGYFRSRVFFQVAGVSMRIQPLRSAYTTASVRSLTSSLRRMALT